MRTVKLAGLIASIAALSSTLALAGPSPKSQGPNTASSKSTGPKSTKAQGASSSKAKGPAATSSTTTKPGNGNAKKTQPASTTASNTTAPDPSSPTTSPTTTPTTWKPTNAVSEKLVTKPNLLQKAKTVLPANTDLNLATAGFKNFGQFNAAVNVSQNLHIDFAQLKLKMTGIPLTGTPPGGTTQPPTTMSLGQAIHDLRRDVNAPVEAEKATRQAELEGGAPTTTTTTSKTKKS